MREYEEFTSVKDPREYLNAPAMLLTDGGDGRTSRPTSSPPPKQPLIVRAAMEYSGNFEILSADELQQYYAEQASLDRRLGDLVNRLDVELKMREAAQSISRLHSGDTSMTGSNRRTSFQSTRSSATMNLAASPKLNHRLSRMFGQDSQAKSDRRLSKQAADEAEASADKIRDLEGARAEIERRKATVDKTIIQHHCAVMSRALSGKPLPNHQQHQRSSSQNSNRQSWIMAPKHQRQWSSTSNGDAASLATVTEHRPNGGSRGFSAGGASAAGQAQPSQIEEELDALIARISQILPTASPSPQGKVAFVAGVFDRLLKDASETRTALEASRVQIDHSQQRLQYFAQQNQDLQTKSNSRELALRNPGHEVALRETQDSLEAEQAKALSWRTRAEQQRRQLEVMAKSLEDVTQLAVRLEGAQGNYEQLVATLETKVGDLLAEKEHFLQQRLRATTNPSLLCQEFQKIVSDLVARHDEEVRALYPKFTKTTLPRDVSLQDIQAQLSEHKQFSRSSSVSRRSSLARRSVERKPVERKAIESHTEPRVVEQPQDETILYPPRSPQRLSRETSPYLQESAGLPRLDMHSSSSTSASSATQARPASTQTDSSVKALYRSSAYASSELKLPSDNVGYRRTPSPLQVPEASTTSIDDSIQHTDEFKMRPSLDRYDTEASDYSKSSSFYPDAPSANQSQASIVARPSQNRGKTQVRKFSYENPDDEIL